jgi:hypothetical protein
MFQRLQKTLRALHTFSCIVPFGFLLEQRLLQLFPLHAVFDQLFQLFTPRRDACNVDLGRDLCILKLLNKVSSHQPTKKLAVVTSEIASLQVYEKSGSAMTNKRPGFFAG